MLTCQCSDDSKPSGPEAVMAGGGEEWGSGWMAVGAGGDGARPMGASSDGQQGQAQVGNQGVLYKRSRRMCG